jgi:hypothetical protein
MARPKPLSRRQVLQTASLLGIADKPRAYDGVRGPIVPRRPFAFAL